MIGYKELVFPQARDSICSKIEELVVIVKLLGYEIDNDAELEESIREEGKNELNIYITHSEKEEEWLILMTCEGNVVCEVEIYDYENLIYEGLDSDEIIKGIGEIMKDL